jgi:hypothetical protein
MRRCKGHRSLEGNPREEVRLIQNVPGSEATSLGYAQRDLGLALLKTGRLTTLIETRRTKNGA